MSKREEANFILVSHQEISRPLHCLISLDLSSLPLHRFLPNIPNHSLFTHQLFTHPNASSFNLPGRYTDRLPAMFDWHATAAWILSSSLTHRLHSFSLSQIHSQASLVSYHQSYLSICVQEGRQTQTDVNQHKQG